MQNPPSRKSLRLNGYDYAQSGAYFITICVKERRALLSRIVGAAHWAARPAHPGGPAPKLSDAGEIVLQCIGGISAAYPSVRVDAYVIMPNHLHLLLLVENALPRCAERAAQCAERAAQCAAPTVSKVVNALKSLTSRRYGSSLWQRSYYDHIVRDEEDYLRIRQYIDDNPARWAEDEYFTG